jgi:Domain of unknown function (DUF4926)
VTSPLKVFDVVALVVDYHEQGLVRGQVGTVVEELSDTTFEVEFCDDTGGVYGYAAVPAHALLQLRYRRVAAGSSRF